MYWIDYKGRRKLPDRIDQNQSRIRDMYLTHPWLVTTLHGTCLGLYLPSAGGSEIVIQ